MHSHDFAKTGRHSLQSSLRICRRISWTYSERGSSATKTSTSFLEQYWLVVYFLPPWLRTRTHKTLPLICLNLQTHDLRVTVAMERKRDSLNKFKTGREGMKARDIEKKYPAEKAKKLVALLKERNLWYWDPDFPQDEEDRGHKTQ